MIKNAFDDLKKKKFFLLGTTYNDKEFHLVKEDQTYIPHEVNEYMIRQLMP